MNIVLASLEQQISDVEALRLSAVRKCKEGKVVFWASMKVAVFIAIAAGLLLIAFGVFPVFGFIIPLIVGFIVGFIKSALVVGDSIKTYSLEYKRKIIGGIVRHLQPEMSYEPNAGISEEAFNSLGQYSRPDRYDTEDLFHGVIGKTAVSFAEVDAEEKRTRKDKDGKRETYWVTLFKGIVFVADFNKDFTARVTVSPDYETDGFFGLLSQKVESWDSKVVRLESPEFEKYFKVRSSDDVQARYLFTPDMQQRMLALRDAISDRMQMVFKDSSLYITIPQNGNWFESDLDVPVNNMQQLEGIAGQMQHLFQIVDILNLNLRIWTKE